jgi:hypothetical protein
MGTSRQCMPCPILMESPKDPASDPQATLIARGEQRLMSLQQAMRRLGVASC